MCRKGQLQIEGMASCLLVTGLVVNALFALPPGFHRPVAAAATATAATAVAAAAAATTYSYSSSYPYYDDDDDDYY